MTETDVERAKPEGMSLFWRAGWHAHMMGAGRTASPHIMANREAWLEGWDARHRLCVLDLMGGS